MIETDGKLFGRLVTAMVTPFDSNDKVDYLSLEKIVNHLITTGTDSIVVSGTTGESPTLKKGEKVDVFRTVRSVADGRAKVIMGTGSNITSKSVDTTKEAEQLGADGVLVVAPYYNKPNQAGLLAHFSAIAQATKLPIIIYNIPGRTGININSDTIIELASTFPNIHALKDSTGNTEQSAEIAGKAPARFSIYSGDDNLTLPFLSVGACGVISVASHIIGKQIKNMMELFFAGQPNEARQIHYEYLSIFKGLFAAPNPTCVKHVLSAMGLCKPNLRLPLVQLSKDQAEQLDILLDQAGIKKAPALSVAKA